MEDFNNNPEEKNGSIFEARNLLSQINKLRKKLKDFVCIANIQRLEPETDEEKDMIANISEDKLEELLIDENIEEIEAEYWTDRHSNDYSPKTRKEIIREIESLKAKLHSLRLWNKGNHWLNNKGSLKKIKTNTKR
jgi:hypothetical protein